MPQGTNIFEGPAPEPQRSLSLGDSPVQPQRAPMGVDFDASAAVPVQMPGIPQVVNSRPPAAPETASEIAAIEARLGDLVRMIGEQREQFARQSAERELEFQLQLAQVRSAAVGPNKDIPEFDPDQPLTQAQFLQAAQNLLGIAEARSLRVNWGISPQHEAWVMQRFPQAQTMPEPQKTQFIAQALRTMQGSASQPGTASPSQAPRPQANPQSGSTPSPAPPAAPHVEPRTAPQVQDNAPTNAALAKALAEYEQAKNIKDPRERIKALRTAMDKVMSAQGMSREDLAKSSFTAS